MPPLTARQIARRAGAVVLLLLLHGLVWPIARPPVFAQGERVDVTGGWVLTVETAMGIGSPTVDFAQDGDRLSGVYVSRYGDFPVRGSLKGRTIEFSITMRPDDPVVITYRGEVAADGRTMKGRADLADAGEATWTAARPTRR